MTNTTQEQVVNMLLGIAREELLGLIEVINHTFERAERAQRAQSPDEYSEADLVNRGIHLFRLIRYIKGVVTRLSE